MSEITAAQALKLLPFTSSRIIASGTGTAVANASTVTLATATRNAGEILLPVTFVIPTGINTPQWAFTGDGTTDVEFFFRRTVTANQFTFQCQNTTAASITVDWAIWGLTP